MKVLVVEDDAALRDVLRRALEENGHIVDVASDGEAGQQLAMDESCDAIILDVMLPKRNGFSVVQGMRAANVRTPVLLLTALTQEADAVMGLDAGADDYLRKPFGIQELMARLRSLTRREHTGRPEPAAALRAGNVALDTAGRKATRDGRDLNLTRRELIFLEYFVRNAGRALSRERMAAALWPTSSDIGSNVIDVYVSRLRNKLHGPGEKQILHTVRGIGYRFDPL